MLAYMKRTTVKLDDALDARMRHEATRRGLTVSEWTREAIAEHLPNGGHQGRARRRFRSAGSGDSGRTDIAERMEEILAGLAEGTDILGEDGDEGRGHRLSA
ncbi:Ribbon-helix-helix protein, copG family [Streptomyces sp. WMMB 322]|nr:Ribbon-helix-helix protein, copG family [Streptomyces sp. WMMB 322]